jgi:WD40 repeat protein
LGGNGLAASLGPQFASGCAGVIHELIFDKMFSSLRRLKLKFSPSIPTTIDCNQQPRWSQKFVQQFKHPEINTSLQQQLYQRDYQDRLITVDRIFAQGETGIPLLIEALRDPYGAVRDKAERYLQTWHDRAEVQDVLEVLRYRQVKCLMTLPGEASITSIRLSPDDRTLLSTDNTDRIRHWDIATGELLQTFIAPDSNISEAIFSADGQSIISNHSSREIWIWDLATNPPHHPRQVLVGHTDRVAALQLAPGGKNLLSGSWDGTIGVWDLTNGQLIERWTGHTDRVQSLTISPDGQTVFSGSADGTIRAWNRLPGQLQQVYNLGKTIVTALAVHPHKPILISGDRQVRLSTWDYAIQEHLDTLPSWTYRPISAIVVSADGEVVLHNCGHNINIWHQATGWFVHALVHHRWAVSCLAMTRDGRRIISGSDDKTIKIWGIPE